VLGISALRFTLGDAVAESRSNGAGVGRGAVEELEDEKDTEDEEE